jgi:hypothetical protein
MDKAVKISIIAGVLIVALSIAYYLVLFLPRKERARVEQQQQQEAKQKECVSFALDKAKGQFQKVLPTGDNGERFVPISNPKNQETYDNYYKNDYDQYYSLCLQGKGL